MQAQKFSGTNSDLHYAKSSTYAGEGIRSEWKRNCPRYHNCSMLKYSTKADSPLCSESSSSVECQHYNSQRAENPRSNIILTPADAVWQEPLMLTTNSQCLQNLSRVCGWAQRSDQRCIDLGQAARQQRRSVEAVGCCLLGQLRQSPLPCCLSQYPMQHDP